MLTEIVLQHGWAFNSSIWNTWLTALGALPGEISITACERGYYGAPLQNATFSKRSAHKVLITHSLGLHLVDREVVQQADQLLIIAGFASFHEENRFSARMVNNMIGKLSTAPHLVLHDFFHSCYATTTARLATLPLLTIASDETLDSDRLLGDLHLLNTSDIADYLSEIEESTEIDIIQGTADQVVPCERALTLNRLLPSANTTLIENGSHALPVTHTGTCMQLLLASLQRKLEFQHAHSSP